MLLCIRLAAALFCRVFLFCVCGTCRVLHGFDQGHKSTHFLNKNSGFDTLFLKQVKEPLFFFKEQ